MIGSADYFFYEFEFPQRETPNWAPLVERWYQLDAYAYGLPQAVTAWQSQLSAAPEMLILASPEGSNRTDYEFAQAFKKTGVGSAARFVHTLPNSRASALLQVMQWNGTMLCIQNDPATILAGIEIACESCARGTVWVLGVTRVKTGCYGCHLFKIQAAPLAGEMTWRMLRDLKFNVIKTDNEILDWAQAAPLQSPVTIGGRLEFSKNLPRKPS